MRLPERLDPPAQVVVCECCWRASCWNGLELCNGVKNEGLARTCITFTAEEVAELAFEEPSFWHPPRAAGEPPRDVLELLDVVQYESTRPNASRFEIRVRLVIYLGIDAGQVDAALAQAWPLRRAS